MKNIIKLSRMVVLTGMVITLCTCKKDKFLNINNNPNYPLTVPVNLALPTTEANIGYMVCNTMGIYGGIFSQYWAQDPTYGSQYGFYDSYYIAASDDDNLWQALYTTATTLNYIIANADSAQSNYAAIAYFMKAYDFQLLDDAFGSIPLSQALQGAANTTPKFDPGQQVYDSLVVWIQDGMKLIQPNSSAPPEDLFFPNQSMAQWQKFANTLLLKVYLRECNVSPGIASAGIKALQTQMTNNGTSFMSVANTDDAKLIYNAVIYQQFPLYATQSYLVARNITGSATVISYFNQLNDPRVKDFYQPNANDSAYEGELQGDWKALSAKPDTGFSPPGPEVLSPTASTRFLTASESLFLQAEAVARGYLTGSASTLYYSGIQASWNSWNYSSTQTGGPLTAYEAQDSVNFSNATTLPMQVRFIITQKWLSMCGNQNFEAWTEWRRTGYPDVFIVSLSSELGGNLMPQRLVYPSAEINDNPNFPGSQPISTPIWWQ